MNFSNHKHFIFSMLPGRLLLAGIFLLLNGALQIAVAVHGLKLEIGK